MNVCTALVEQYRLWTTEALAVKVYASAKTLSTTNLIWTGLGLNPGPSERFAANHLSHGAQTLHTKYMN